MTRQALLKVAGHHHGPRADQGRNPRRGACWVALDRAVALAGKLGAEAPPPGGGPPHPSSWLTRERPAGAATVTRTGVLELQRHLSAYLERVAAGAVCEIAYREKTQPPGERGRVLGYLSSTPPPAYADGRLLPAVTVTRAATGTGSTGRWSRCER